MAEAQPRTPANKTRLRQRITHARYALHRIHRCPYALRRDPCRGLQIAQLPQLAKRFKRVFFAGEDKPRSLPRLELARMQVQNPHYVLTAISGHCVSRTAPSGRFSTTNSFWSMPLGAAPIKTLSCRVY